jgi:cyclopropane fatty-acyl-phospholipid synthase-like methyltransferase
MPESLTTAEWITSPYYELFEKNDKSKKEPFIGKLLQKLQPAANATMLEVGCKTGEISKQIAEMGFDVTGIDFSQKLVEIAKELESDNLHFFQHDVRLPFWINFFDYALNLFTAFGNYKTLREHDNAIRSISQSLKTNALFVMDYINVHYEEDHLQASDQKKIGAFDFNFTQWQDDEHFYKKIDVKQDGVIKNTFADTVIKLSIGDLTDMLAYQGLQIQEVFGDYNFADYDIRHSERLILIAKKIRR